MCQAAGLAERVGCRANARTIDVVTTERFFIPRNLRSPLLLLLVCDASSPADGGEPRHDAGCGKLSSQNIVDEVGQRCPLTPAARACAPAPCPCSAPAPRRPIAPTATPLTPPAPVPQVNDAKSFSLEELSELQAHTPRPSTDGMAVAERVASKGSLSSYPKSGASSSAQPRRGSLGSEPMLQLAAEVAQHVAQHAEGGDDLSVQPTPVSTLCQQTLVRARGRCRCCCGCCCCCSPPPAAR